MLRVAHVIQSVDDRSGGTSSAFLEVMASLAAQPDLAPVAYTTRPADTDAAAAAIRACPERWCLADSVGRTLAAGALGRLLSADLARGGIDVLHLHGLWSPDLLAAARAARRAGVPCVWQPHGMLLGHALAQKALKKRIFMRFGLAAALRAAAAYVFCSVGERDHSVLPAGSDPGRRHVVFLPVTIPAGEADIPRFRAEGRAAFALPSDAPVLAFLGRLHPVKRLELALHAFAAAAPKLPAGATFALFGSGDEAYARSLRDLAASLGVADRVRFPGWISGDDKWRALAAADALILCSLHENFGYTVPEALGVRTPVVMTDNLSLAPDVAAASARSPSGPFAHVTPPDPAPLAEAIARALTAPVSLAAGASARRWVLDTFAPTAIGSQLAVLYRSLPGAAAGIAIPTPEVASP